METYYAGNQVAVQVPFRTLSGAVITGPDSASYRVLDVAGVEVVVSTALTPGPTDNAALITVSAVNNELDLDEAKDLRVVEVTFTEAGATHVVKEHYVLLAPTYLVAPANSFQTLSESLLNSTELTEIEAFQSADELSKTTALVNAFHNLNRLTYYVNGVTYTDMASLTDLEFAALPVRFKKAIALAQIVEANEALAGDTLHKKRQAGLMSETIGESSMFFRPEKVLLLPVTRRSINLLMGYITWGMRIGRG